MTHYTVEELYGLISDPMTARYSGAIVRRYKAIFDPMQALPKVIIAAMNGDAMGGGFELTLACDLRIGQKGDFRYGNPELRVGLIPGAGGTQRLTRLIGVSRAIERVLRALIVKPEVALGLNLVHEVVDDATARALELPEEIATFPPKAVENAKIALYLGADTNIQAGFEIENMQWTEVMLHDDARLALESYIAEGWTRAAIGLGPPAPGTIPATPAAEKAFRRLRRNRPVAVSRLSGASTASQVRGGPFPVCPVTLLA